jgi:hypothetical protein
MNVKVYKLIYICLLVIFGLAACSRPPLEPGHLVGDAADGRAAWARMVELKSLKGTAILSWKATDSRKGKHKVRLFLEPPERLKIQWLTPWGSVAGQLLMVDDQFWFSDSRQRLTWHGLTADFKSLFEQKENLDWSVATHFFRYWPLLFSSPEEDDRTYGKQASFDYLVTDKGRYLNKVIRFKNGDEMHVRLDDLETLADNRLMAHNIEALSHSGRISLTLRQFTLQKELAPENFIYNLKNFKLHEWSVIKGDTHVGK